MRQLAFEARLRVSAEHSDMPMYFILPALRASSIAPIVSSIGLYQQNSIIAASFSLMASTARLKDTNGIQTTHTVVSTRCW